MRVFGLTFIAFSSLAFGMTPEAREFLDISKKLEPVQCEKRQLRRRRLLAWMLLVAAPLAAFAQGVPSDEKGFTGYVTERLRRAMPELVFKPSGPLGVDAAGPDGKAAGRLGVERVWQFCTRNYERCAKAVDEYVVGITEFLREQTGPVALAKVRLVVRSEDYIVQARRQMAEGKAELLARPLVSGLWVVPVVDSPRSMRMLVRQDLAALKLDEEALFELGRRNLREQLKPLSDVARVPRPGEIGRLGEDDYESSRLLLHGEWAELAERMKHQLVVMVPASNLLIYGEASNAQAVEGLRALGREAARGSEQPLSLALLRWTLAGWEIVSP